MSDSVFQVVYEDYEGYEVLGTFRTREAAEMLRTNLRETSEAYYEARQRLDNVYPAVGDEYLRLQMQVSDASIRFQSFGGELYFGRNVDYSIKEYEIND